MYIVSELAGFYPTAINASDEVCGISHGDMRPVLWKSGILADLGNLFSSPGCFGGAIAINDAGTVVGYCAEDEAHGGAYIGFRWDNGNISALSLPDGYSISQPNSINSKGDIAGFLQRPVPTTGYSVFDAACVWYADGSIKVFDPPQNLIDVLGAPLVTGAFAINDHGDVGLSVCTPTGDFIPFLVSGSQWIAVSEYQPSGWPLAVNNQRTVVGTYFWWDPNSGWNDLTSLDMNLNAISNTGTAVGDTFSQSWAQIVDLPSNTYVPLDSLLPPGTPWSLGTATGINTHGHIVGNASKNGIVTGFFLSATHRYNPQLPRWVRYTPPRKLPTYVPPGDPALTDFFKGTTLQRARHALIYAARLLQGSDRQDVEAIAKRIGGKSIRPD